MGIPIDADDVIPRLQDIAAVSAHVVGGHILHVERERQGLVSAGFQYVGLVKSDEVGAGLLDAAVGVGRVVVDLYHVLSGHAAGVSNGDIEGDRTAAF